MRKIMFSDIAGYEIEKAEAKKIVNILQNYNEYIKEGITLPKGILLSGNPGVGKTSLALAIANEANANLVELKNVDNNIVEVINDAFLDAKSKAPSILFIDELDQMVTSVVNQVTENQKLILKTLLTNIEGLSDSNGVIVIATAQTARFIPKALLRSGRIEKQIKLKEPKFETRKRIFSLYFDKFDIQNKSIISYLARKTEGFTGADIKRLVNEGLITSKTRECDLNIGIFEEYIPVIRNNALKHEVDFNNIKYTISHEMGHFICNYYLNNDIGSISIESYDEILGSVQMDKSEDRVITFKNYKNIITVLLGGLAGEFAILDDATLGSESDVSKVYDVFNSVIQSGLYGTKYYLETTDDYFEKVLNMSDFKMSNREAFINSVYNECFNYAKEIIKANIHIYELLKPYLEKEYYLSSDKIKKIFQDNNVTLKQIAPCSEK